MEQAEALAVAALWGAIHNLRFMINRGLVRPREVEEFFSAVIEGLESGDVAKAAIWVSQLDPLMIDLKEAAEKTWIAEDDARR